MGGNGDFYSQTPLGASEDLFRKQLSGRRPKSDFDRTLSFLDPGRALFTGKGGEPITFGQEALQPYAKVGQGVFEGMPGRVAAQEADIASRLAYMTPSIRAGEASLYSQAEGLRGMIPQYSAMRERYSPYLQDVLKTGFEPTSSRTYQRMFGEATGGIRASLAARGLGRESGPGAGMESLAMTDLSQKIAEGDFQRMMASLGATSQVETGMMGAEQQARLASEGALSRALTSQLGLESGMAGLQQLPLENYLKISQIGAGSALGLASAEAQEAAAQLGAKGGMGQGMGQLGAGLMMLLA